MKFSDVTELQEAGLITAEQRTAIISHFKLDQEKNKILVILAILGGILIAGGVILLIASNWMGIPPVVKIASGIGFMIAAHWGGVKLQRDATHPIIAEALHLIGSGLFLGNIALVGQIYNLSSRPPNAILLWLVGIAPLAWILRSKTQHILTLCAFVVWIGMEADQTDSWVYFGGDVRELMFYMLLGVGFAGWGMCLRRSSYATFGPATEKFGILVMQIAAYPLAFDFQYGWPEVHHKAWVVIGSATVAAMPLIAINVNDRKLLADRQWRYVWLGAFWGVILLAWVGMVFEPSWRLGPDAQVLCLRCTASVAMFLFCMLQAQVGILRGIPWLVNVAMVFLGLHVMTVFFELLGSMQTTGLTFVISGIALILMAIYLEKKRRALLKRIQKREGIQP